MKKEIQKHSRLLRNVESLSCQSVQVMSLTIKCIVYKILKEVTSDIQDLQYKALSCGILLDAVSKQDSKGNSPLKRGL